MRIFALETDVAKIKQSFMVEGEQELLTVHHHWICFFTFASRGLIVLFLLFITSGVAMMEIVPPIVPSIIGLILGVVLFFIFINAIIQWRYNFLIVTTEKLVVVTQISLFHQAVKPTSYENVASSRSESQFFGLVRAGVLFINLKQRLQGSSQELILRHMPRPEEITSVIENALVIMRQKSRPEDSQATPATQVPEVQQQAGEVLASS